MDTIELNGRRYGVKFEYDYDADAPWDGCDGHGAVRQSNRAHAEGRSDKRPGERPLNHAGRNEYQFYYNWQGACELARTDGWNAEPYDAPGRILRAVQADFDYLRGYVNQDWQYVGVIVTLLDENGEETGESDALWSVETYEDYHHTVAAELAAEIDARQIRLAKQQHVGARFHDAMACGL